MATYDWPASFYPSDFEWGNVKAALAFRSPYNGTPQSIDLVAERWTMSLVLPPRVWSDAGAVAAFLGRLVGGANRVRLYHRTRPTPRGTMRGAPAIQTVASRGNAALSLQTVAGATLRAGDLFKVASQLFMAAEDCMASGSGVLVVPLVHRVRSTLAVGTAVEWNRPTAEFIAPTLRSSMSYDVGASNPVSVDLEEVW